ncbi:hypothetical protein COLO4_36881 [Corchorus olitorius]|uniref:Uncharacterized protein n=1 Tax=Corchorus olitorius TaxID=93759 RepID=A0A1R3G4J1_9ROSI|nr:hypothetical protein COLO4_36881 [Corchorus olitorius]
MENQFRQSRNQSWFKKQFSSRNGQENLLKDKEGAHEAAVAAAAFAIQSVEEAKIGKLKSKSRKDNNGRNGMIHSNGLTSQSSYKRTKSAVEISKKKPMEPKSKEMERAYYSAAKPSFKSSAIPITPGDHAHEWYDKLKSVVACGSDTVLKAN